MTTEEAFLIEAKREESEAPNLELAWKHFAEGRVTESRNLLSEIISRSPSHYDRCLETPETLYVKVWDENGAEWTRRISGTRNLKKKIVNLFGAYTLAYNRLGYLLIEIKEYEEAIKVLVEGLSLVPDHPALCVEIAQAMFHLDMANEAVAFLDHAMKGGSFSTLEEITGCLNAKGYAHLELGELDAAEKAYRDSLIYAPENEAALNELTHISDIRRLSARFNTHPFRLNSFFRSYMDSPSNNSSEASGDQLIDLARNLKALTEMQIEKGRNSPHDAAMNRLEVRLAAEEFIFLHMKEIGIENADGDNYCGIAALASMLMAGFENCPNFANSETGNMLKGIYERECRKNVQ
jgi:tetratricopeptide (TPR) repeat protein